MTTGLRTGLKLNYIRVAKRGERFDSSAIEVITYDLNAQELGIVFSSNPAEIYLYRFVPLQIVNELLDAESKGNFFSSAIRLNYDYIKTPYNSYVFSFERVMALEKLSEIGQLYVL